MTNEEVYKQYYFLDKSFLKGFPLSLLSREYEYTDLLTEQDSFLQKDKHLKITYDSLYGCTNQRWRIFYPLELTIWVIDKYRKKFNLDFMETFLFTKKIIETHMNRCTKASHFTLIYAIFDRLGVSLILHNSNKKLYLCAIDSYQSYGYDYENAGGTIYVYLDSCPSTLIEDYTLNINSHLSTKNDSFIFYAYYSEWMDIKVPHCLDNSISKTATKKTKGLPKNFEYKINQTLIDFYTQIPIQGINENSSRINFSKKLRKSFLSRVRWTLFWKTNWMNKLYWIQQLVAETINHTGNGKDALGIAQLPEQTLASQQGDCEDFVILEAALIHHLLRRKCILVAFFPDSSQQHIPGHAVLGIRWPKKISIPDKAETLVYNNHIYVLLEPQLSPQKVNNFIYHQSITHPRLVHRKIYPLFNSETKKYNYFNYYRDYKHVFYTNE